VNSFTLDAGNNNHGGGLIISVATPTDSIDIPTDGIGLMFALIALVDVSFYHVIKQTLVYLQ